MSFIYVIIFLIFDFIIQYFIINWEIKWNFDMFYDCIMSSRQKSIFDEKLKNYLQK